MAPPQPSARRGRPRKIRAFLANREDLEIRVVPALLAANPAALAISPAILMQPNSPVIPTTGIPVIPQGGGSGSPVGYTPQQIRTGYGLNGISFGSLTGDGTGQTIAIVDAYDDPGLVDSTASNFSTSDLAQFDKQFHLPDPPSFLKLNENAGTTGLPGTDPAGAGSSSGNWEYEEAMDVEWAHAIAPGANIVLIEADTNSFSDLFTAVTTAANLAGVSTVSLSWGSPEDSSETGWDPYFLTPTGHQGVTFVAATGDGGSPGIDPAYSPNVVAAGGTAVSLASDGTYLGESAWSSGGGGVSSFESEPAYQESVQNTGYRTIPDVSFNSSRSPGVAVYDSYDDTGGGPWNSMGGTSVAAPAWAALIAIADQGRVAMGGTTLDGPSQTLPALYSLPSTDFHDITSGGNGGYNAGPGYDEATGLGTPVANLLVPDLASYGLPARLNVAAQPPSSLAAGSPFGLTVSVDSPDGQLLTDASGTITISLSNDPGGAALNGTLTEPIKDGVATFSGLSIDKDGIGFSLLFSGGGMNSATSASFNVVPATASQLVISSQPPASVTAGGAFGLAVSVEDAYGNLESEFDGSVSLALVSDPVGASLAGNLTATTTGGVADFHGLSLDQAGRGFTIAASASGLTTVTTQSFDVEPSTPSLLVVTSEPSRTITAGLGFGLALAVEDAYGNLDPSYNGKLSVTISGGPAGARLNGMLSISAIGGVVNFSGLGITEAGAGYTLEVSGNGLTAATTTAFAVTPASASQLVVGAPPASVAAGQGFSVTVSVEDAYGNLENSFGGSINLALGANPAGGSLGGDLTLQATGGVADFSSLILTTAGSGFTIEATSHGLSAATTPSFTVTPGAPSQLVINGEPPTSITAGNGIGLIVKVEDAFGNLETAYDSSVSVGLSGGPVGAVLKGTLSGVATSGMASFSGLTIAEAGSGFVLDATSGGLTVATSSFAVAPASPSQLVVSSEPPTDVAAGTGFGLSVSIEDAYGNLESDDSGEVTVDLSGGPNRPSLGGTLTIPASGGIADFSGLTLTRADDGYTLNASSDGLAGVSTTRFTVTPSTPSQVVVTTQPPSVVTAGNNFGLSVAVEDAFGNAEPNYGGKLSVALSGGSGQAGLGGTLAISASGGLGQFAGLTIDQAGSGYTLQVGADGLEADSTPAIQITPTAASGLVVVDQPPASVIAGQPFGLTIAAVDSFGNIETSFDGTVTASLAVNPGGAPLTGAATVRAAGGLARFSGLMIDQAHAGYILNVAAGTLSSAKANSLEVVPASATRLVVIASLRRV